jgi:serine/threonine-protein kinase
MTELEAGSRLGRYRIEGVLGRGGMGIVYRAVQDDLDRAVALKVIAPTLAADHDFRARFQREARLAASLDHPNVIPVHEAGTDGDTLYLAMRLVPGEDLASLVKRDGPLPAERVVAIIAQTASALDAAHAAGLVHRDVKPHNILMAGEHAYLTDFGLTKSTSSDATLTRTGIVLGTVDYAAPEQLRGEATDGRSDVYSLACTAFYLLAGEPPFPRTSDTARMLAHLNDPPPDLPSAPPPLSGVIKQGMAKVAGDRFATAGEFAQALTAALNDPKASASVGKAAKAGATAPGMPRWVRLALGVTLPLILIAGIVFALTASGGDDDKKPSGQQQQAEVPTATATATPTDGGSTPDADAPRPVASIPVGDLPDGIAVGDGVVWVVSSNDGTLERIDAETNKVDGEPVAAGSRPDSVAADKGIVYVTSHVDNLLLRFEARPDAVPAGTVRVGTQPEGVSLGLQLVWVALAGDGTVRRIDRASNDLVGGPIGVGAGPITAFVGDGRVWVPNSEDGTVSVIDSTTAEPIGEPVAVGSDPRDVVEAFGFAWVVVRHDNAVVRLDLETHQVVGDPIPVGRGPIKIAAGEGALWVTNRKDDTVSQINPETFRVAGRPLPVGQSPVNIAAGLGAVWVANTQDDTVTRIDPGKPLVQDDA